MTLYQKKPQTQPLRFFLITSQTFPVQSFTRAVIQILFGGTKLKYIKKQKPLELIPKAFVLDCHSTNAAILSLLLMLRFPS